jgi:hypothetical protein
LVFVMPPLSGATSAGMPGQMAATTAQIVVSIAMTVVSRPIGD